jgi:hypothetical protein
MDKRRASMTPDGVVPDLHQQTSREPRRLPAEGRAPADPSIREHPMTDPSVDRLWQVRILLQDARDELLRVHASTVLAMGRLSRDQARMTAALAQARSQHEALFLVRRAVDALTTPAPPAGR